VTLVLLGIWGALIPFVGPYFHFAYTPDQAWDATAGRLWLEIVPGVVALLAGLVVLLSGFRPAAVFGAWVAAVAGAWFAVGHLIAAASSNFPNAGTPVGGAARAALEQIGFFTGLGVVIVFVAAVALGRFTVIAASDKGEPEDRDAADVGRRRATAGLTDDRVPVGSSATQAMRRATARTAAMVPVFRGKQRSAASNASAGRRAAEADIAAGRAR
jgi:hypothetical protein